MFLFSDQDAITERWNSLLNFLKDTRQQSSTYTYTVKKEGSIECYEENGKYYCSLPGVSDKNLRIHTEKIKDLTFTTIIGIADNGKVFSDILTFTGATDYIVCSDFTNGLLEISFKK